MSALVIYPDEAFEAAEGGSKEFRREAVRFLAFHQLGPDSVYRFDSARPREARAPGVLAAIEARRDLSLLAVFSHGWASGIQAGFSVQTAPRLARALAQRSRPELAVVLYCCSAAKGEVPATSDAPGGDGGFADALRDALCAQGVTQGHVDAHTTVGHCTRNAYVRRFTGTGTAAPGRGGRWLVEPGSPKWSRWAQALADTDLRWRFPLLLATEIAAELDAER